jgi:hypothetical protein
MEICNNKLPEAFAIIFFLGIDRAKIPELLLSSTFFCCEMKNI